MATEDFVVNRHGRLVFPSNAWLRLDFSVFGTVAQLGAAVSRDFEAKAPSASLIVSRLEADEYPSRYEFFA
jgi:3-oxoacyl-[acyl-carrier-protein] synthase III